MTSEANDDVPLAEPTGQPDGSPAPAGAIAPPADDRVELPSGEALSPVELDEFLRFRSATIVSLIGERSSGKTTLIASIYGRFLKGPFAGRLFAGSRSLLAFERIIHDSRVDSGRAVADTHRTSRSETASFLHLATAAASAPSQRVDLMISDRAGEDYADARGISSLVSGFLEIQKADRVVVLLDGARIRNRVERAEAVQAVRQMIRALLDGGALSERSVVQVVTTKMDLLAGGDDDAETSQLLTSFRDDLTSAFGARLGELTYWEVAARDPLGKFELAHGVDALLMEWNTPRELPKLRSDVAPEPTDEFDRLAFRPRPARWS